MSDAGEGISLYPVEPVNGLCVKGPVLSCLSLLYLLFPLQPQLLCDKIMVELGLSLNVFHTNAGNDSYFISLTKKQAMDIFTVQSHFWKGIFIGELFFICKIFFIRKIHS